MNYRISNGELTVEISSIGGEFQSVKDKDGREYLWQGDEATWKRKGPTLFPYIGRMTEKSYTYGGKKYNMDIHGFLPNAEMELVEKKEDLLTLGLLNSPETEKQYPFAFALYITWKLEGQKLLISMRVENKDEKTMYFGIGGHPGFQVPFEDGLSFEDYRIDFGPDAELVQQDLSDDCFVLESDRPLELDQGRYLNLRHDLFDNDAIVLNRTPKEVSISSEKGKKEIRVAFEWDNLGIWHWPHAEVNYVCIEPWSSLPSRKNIVEDLETQPGLLSLDAGKVYETVWSVSVGEKQ